MSIELGRGARAPQLNDTIVWNGEDGWEPHPLPLPPSAITQIHTNTIMRIAMGETRSPNFEAGASGWCIYPDGSAEFNDIVARGTIYATAGVIGGWAILPAYLAKDTGTDATSAGMAPLDFPFYAGATYANRATAPFRVTPAGAIMATSGTIGGWSITSAYIAKDTGLDATSAGMAPGDYPFYAGTVYANRAAAPFRVTIAGALYATGATITGTLTATTGNIGGWTINATSLTGGNATLHSTGYLLLGTTTDVVRIDATDVLYRIWVGAILGADAPFSVTKAGALKSTSGEIGGWTIAATYLVKDTGVDATSVGLAPADFPFYAGAMYANRAIAPFRVTPAGALVATSATISGSITATSGTIGGWTVNAASITGGDATLHSTGYLLLGTGDDVVRLDATDVTYRLWIGDPVGGSAPFRVSRTGCVHADNAYITGDIDANSGHIGTLDIDGVLSVGAAAPYIQISGPGKYIRTSTFTSGLQGFTIESDGSAEFNNVDVRGAIKVSVLQYGHVLAASGSVWVTPSAGRLLVDCVSVDSPTTFDVDIEDPDGMTHVAAGTLWAVGDVIRMKEALVGDLWATVSGKTDRTTYWRLAIVKQSPGAGTNYTFRAGLAILNYGASGKGMIQITADATNAPYMQMATHAGSPWTALTARLRIGNLNGAADYVAETYGMITGQYGVASQTSLTVDDTNGIRIFNNTTKVAQWDASGNILIGQAAVSQNNVYITAGAISIRNNTTERIGLTAAGILTIKDSAGAAVFTFNAGTGAEFTLPLTIGASGGIYQGTGTFAAPTTGLKIWNDSGIGRLATYNAGVAQVYFGTDGKLAAGAGKVVIDSTGVHIDVEGSTPSSGRIVFEDFDATYDFWAMLWTYTSGAAYKFSLRNRAATATYTTAVTSLTAEGSAATVETVSEVYLSAPGGWSGLRAAAGTSAMVGVWDGAATVVRPKTTWNSGGNIVHKLFDAAGATKLSIQDSAEVEVAYINSDGNALLSGDVRTLGDEAGVGYRLNAFKTPTEHFNVAAMPAGWSWAGAPFVTPTGVSFAAYPSIMYITDADLAAERWFLYRANPIVAAMNTYLAFAMNTNDVGANRNRCGIRLDDGTDNNFAEAIVEQTTALPAVWTFYVRSRSGGGAITATAGSAITVPLPFLLSLYVGGTLWTNWTASCQIFGLYSSLGFSNFRQANAGGLAWTPTRFGIIMETSGVSSWYSWYIDAVSY